MVEPSAWMRDWESIGRIRSRAATPTTPSPPLRHSAALSSPPSPPPYRLSFHSARRSAALSSAVSLSSNGLRPPVPHTPLSCTYAPRVTSFPQRISSHPSCHPPAMGRVPSLSLCPAALRASGFLCFSFFVWMLLPSSRPALILQLPAVAFMGAHSGTVPSADCDVDCPVPSLARRGPGRRRRFLCLLSSKTDTFYTSSFRIHSAVRV